MSRYFFRFCCGCIVFCVGIVLALKSVDGEEPQENILIQNDKVGGLYSIRGIVTDTTPDISDESFREFAHLSFALDNNAPEDLEKFQVYSEALFPKTVRSGVVVSLDGNSIKRETETDSSGEYRFANLPPGTYTLIARAPVLLYCRAKASRMAMGLARAQIPSDAIKNIDINAFHVNIKGGVHTSDGQPIAGARVTGTPFALRQSDNRASEYREKGAPIITITDEAGNYELQGFKPFDTSQLARHLFNSYWSQIIEVRVNADGYIQATNNVPKIPPVAGELIPAARHMVMFLADFLGGAWERPIHVQERNDLPASDGNTITGIDIIMDRIDTSSPPSAESPPTSN